MTEQAGIVARTLVHDVGKYVSRAARNLPPKGAIPAVLVDMLFRDVLGTLPSGLTPSERFEALAAELGTSDPRIDEVRARFSRIAALERELARGTELVVRSVAAEALGIDEALRSLAKELSR
ncbi:MAG: hypothetical protein U0234_32395 [Sandaracinus sp.]